MKTDLEFKGWTSFQEMLGSPSFVSLLHQNIEKANRRLSVLGSARLISEIKSSQFHANSPLTVAMKGSSKPLVDNGTLIGNVSGSVGLQWNTFDVGVLRRTATGKNLAHMLETGWTQKVTPKMRNLFYAVSRESKGRVKPLKSSTTHIRVPPRPFMRQAFFDDKKFGRMVQQQWTHAVDQTFVRFAEKGKAESFK